MPVDLSQTFKVHFGSTLSNPRYQAALDEAKETRRVDFKAPMDWSKDQQCERLEIVKDVAAMANSGGGLIIIGRHKPSFETGSINSGSLPGFDPTKVNQFFHRYLAPKIECLVAIEATNAGPVVVIDVPSFDTTPLITHVDGNCGAKGHEKAPHFKSAEIYFRSKAAETRRISDPEEMRELLSLASRQLRDETLDVFRRQTEALMQSMRSIVESLPNIQQSLGESVPESDPNEDPKRTDFELENKEFFYPFFYPWLTMHGRYDLRVVPAIYKSERIELKRLPALVRELAFVVNRNGIFDSVPYESTNQIEHARFGVRLKGRKPQWRRVEAVSLAQSGAYRLIRAFPEDYRPTDDKTRATMVDDDRSLWVDALVDTVTMLGLLAARVATQTATDSGEDFDVHLRIHGLARRQPQANSLQIEQQLRLTLAAHEGSTDSFEFEYRDKPAELAKAAVQRAADQCNQILWTFGLRDDIAQRLQRTLGFNQS